MQAKDVVSSHRVDVQGLRAVAVLLVLATHALGIPSGGYVGVDVFFVLSGFLITGLLVREHAHTGRIDLRGFYGRRARRLLPAGLLALAATNLATSLLLGGERSTQALTDSTWAAAFLANVHFAAVGTDYFDQTRPPSPVQHYWSLAVEEQFYLVWPVLLLGLLLLFRRRPPAVVPAVLILTAVSFAWGVRATQVDASAAYFSTAARAWELGVGALLALVLHAGQLPRLGARAAAALTWTGLAGIAAAAVLLDERTAFPGTAAALPVLATALVLVGGSAGYRDPLLTCRLGTAVGDRSYSLYLWHWPVVVVAAALLAPGPLRTVAVLAGSAALAVVSYRLVEQPFRSGARQADGICSPQRAATRRRAWLRPLVAGASLLALGWGVPAAALGAPTPPPAPAAAPAGPAPADAAGTSAAALADAIDASLAPVSWPRLDLPLETISHSGAPEWLVDRCDNVNAGNLSRCRYGDPNASLTAAVVGDSMATSWLPALRALLEPRGWSVQVLTRNQCPLPQVGLWRERPSEPFVQCDDHKRWAFEQVRRLSPDLVVASNSLTFLDHQAGEPSGAARFPAWQRGMEASLRELVAASGRVVLLGPPPRAGNLQSCVHRLSAPEDCTTQLSADWADLRTAERAAASRAGAEYLDVEPLFCRSQRCPAVVGRTPVYTDGRHLTAAYARRLAPHLDALLDLDRSTAGSGQALSP